MAAHRRDQKERGWAFGVLAGLFVVLLSWTGAWSQRQDLQAKQTTPRRAEKRLSVAVQQTQLSVDAQGVDVRELLAQIGQQANIRMLVAPNARRQINVQFAGIELNEGLRRLFRLASLSHAILYARGSGGTVWIAEVHVFGEEPRGVVPPDRAPPEAGERQEGPASSEPSAPELGHYIHRVISDSSG